MGSSQSRQRKHLLRRRAALANKQQAAKAAAFDYHHEASFNGAGGGKANGFGGYNYTTGNLNHNPHHHSHHNHNHHHHHPSQRQYAYENGYLQYRHAHLPPPPQTGLYSSAFDLGPSMMNSGKRRSAGGGGDGGGNGTTQQLQQPPREMNSSSSSSSNCDCDCNHDQAACYATSCQSSLYRAESELSVPTLLCESTNGGLLQATATATTTHSSSSSSLFHLSHPIYLPSPVPVRASRAAAKHQPANHQPANHQPANHYPAKQQPAAARATPFSLLSSSSSSTHLPSRLLQPAAAPIEAPLTTTTTTTLALTTSSGAIESIESIEATKRQRRAKRLRHTKQQQQQQQRAAAVFEATTSSNIRSPRLLTAATTTTNEQIYSRANASNITKTNTNANANNNNILTSGQENDQAAAAAIMEQPKPKPKPKPKPQTQTQPQQKQKPQANISNLNKKMQVNNNNNNNNQNGYKQMMELARVERGLALTDKQRSQLGLLGLLPAAIQNQEVQIKAVINFIDTCKDELSKYVYLRNLKDFNERLFYSSLIENVEKLMPLVYTPTVGLACQKFSQIYLKPRGLFVTINDLNRVPELLANWPEQDVRVIVVTDGERILGLGDQGANGMGISIGKLSLYTALAGIPPKNVLPITIDVGTNNEQNLKDPFYIGLRQQRVRGRIYDNLLEEFMQSVSERWGRSCLIQFEDFANSTAFNLLQRYRDKYCTFNDDIQGTASVCLSGLLSATKLINRRLADCTFLFYGAGEANLGTANLLIMAMQEEGASKEEAKKKIWLCDSKGLVVSSRTDLSSHKLAFAQEGEPQLSDLEEIVAYTKPLAIIGASAQSGAFNESICKRMAQINERPIIFALSNPTSKAECTAQEAYEWTDGKCVFASGSPFEPVNYKGKTYVTGQGNNAYIFPGVGLAAIGAHVNTIPEDTFLVAARALSDQLTSADTLVGLVYPSLTKIREVTLKIATRVLEHFYSERLATYRPEPEDKLNFLRSIQYDCRYESS